MAVKTYPLNGIKYLAEDAETYLCTRTSGVYSAEDNFSVTVSGENRQIIVGPGLAWIKNGKYAGKSVLSDSPVTVETGIADGVLSRIDRIVLRFDKGLNNSKIMIKAGTPGSLPQPPTVERTELVYELGLYTVSVKAGSSVITPADVKSTMLDETVCGIMRDGVTGIPTAQILQQAEAMLETFESEKFTEFDAWFQGIKDVLDQETATRLYNMIDTHIKDKSNPHSVTVAQIGAATTATYTATLTASGWSTGAPYTQTVSVPGILASDNPIVDLLLTTAAEQESWGKISKIQTGAGSITATCLEEKPEVNLKIQLKAVR